MGQLQFTIAASGLPFTIDESQVLFVETDTLGSKVTYVNEVDGSKLSTVVTQAKTTIATASDNLLQVTKSDGSTPLVNIERINLKDKNSTGAYFEYDNNGATNITIQTSSTFGTFMSALLTKKGETVRDFDDVSATNNTISLAAAEGDLTSTYVNGVVFTTFGSSTNAMNSLWTVDSSAYSGGKTVITVTETVPAGASETGYLYI